MKILKQLTKFLPMLLLAVGVFACSDDDKDNAVQQAIPITFNTNRVALWDEEGQKSKVIEIKSEGQFAVKSLDEKIATASLNGKSIAIRLGTKSGATTILVTGNKGEKGEIAVNAGIYDLAVDRDVLNMKPGEKAEVKILSGNFTFAGDDLIVEAVNEPGDNNVHFDITKAVLWKDAMRTTMTVKALKAGKSTIRITDKKGKQTEIALDVLDIQLNSLAISKTKVDIYGIGVDVVEVINGNGEYKYEFTDKTVVALVNVGTVAKPTYLLKAQKSGSTVLTIMDELTGQSLAVNVNVKAYTGVASKLPAGKWMGVDFKKYATMYPDKVANWASIPELTWEAEAKINAGSAATLMGIEGQFLVRTPFAASNTFISVCVGDNPNVYSEMVLDRNKYYKFAFIVNFRTKTTDIYIDGVKLAVKTAGGINYSRGGLDLTAPNNSEEGLFAIGRAYGGRFLDGGVRYIRMWTRCLTDKEVKDNTGRLYVDPTSPGLLAEWVFEGNVGATEFKSLNEPYFTATVKGGAIDTYE